MLAELSDLFHLARTALAGSSLARGDYRRWAAREYEKLRPEVCSDAAYKELDRQDSWRY